MKIPAADVRKGDIILSNQFGFLYEVRRIRRHRYEIDFCQSSRGGTHISMGLDEGVHLVHRPLPKGKTQADVIAMIARYAAKVAKCQKEGSTRLDVATMKLRAVCWVWELSHPVTIALTGFYEHGLSSSMSRVRGSGPQKLLPGEVLDVLHFNHVLDLFNVGGKTQEECLRMLPFREHNAFLVATDD